MRKEKRRKDREVTGRWGQRLGTRIPGYLAIPRNSVKKKEKCEREDKKRERGKGREAKERWGQRLGPTMPG